VFRPCIDLRDGRVTQIVGGTLDTDSVEVNFVAEQPASWFASLYRSDALTGGHVIKLGPGNDAAACEALAAWPGGLQIGGGVTADNAPMWIDRGASHVIVTSWLFTDGQLRHDRLDRLVQVVDAERIVIDLSCRGRGNDHVVVVDRWQRFTNVVLSADVLGELAPFCAEFLVHGVDVEGLAQGIDTELVRRLAAWSPIPVTYAGGARSVDDLQTVQRESDGRVDLTIGSALDIFGGSGARYADCVAWNRRHTP
jgi:phosphoribosylformimino-5-aminoimidazole carboxamide ribotide isomerase